MIKVGDRLKDNDPRMGSGNRLLEVTAVMADFVEAATVYWYGMRGKPRRYLIRRIHTDGKPRKSGLSLIREED